jgi:hypothetical protein
LDELPKFECIARGYEPGWVAPTGRRESHLSIRTGSASVSVSGPV